MTKLYKHQQEALDIALKHDRFALFMDFGTGKTLVALHWLKEKKAFPCLVICPKSVIPHWYRECMRFTPAICTPFNSDREWGEANINAINYEQLKKMGGFDGRFNSIIVDESTYVKNHGTKRTKLTKKITNNKKFVLLLTALPAPHHYDDLFSQFNILDSSVFGNNYWQFINHYYVDIRRYPKFNNIPKVWFDKGETELKKKYYQSKHAGFPVRMLRIQRQKELLRKVKSRSIIIDKSVLDLPDKQCIKLQLIPTTTQLQHFELVKADQMRTSLQRFMGCQRVASGFSPWINQPIRSAKLEALIDIRHSLGSEKLLIWAYYRADIERINRVIGDSCLDIHGEIEDRDSRLQMFLHDDRINTLVCQQRAFGVGTNIAPVRYAVYYSNSFNYEDRAQSEDRIHRIGQTDKVFIIDLVVHETDQQLLDAYGRGQSIQEYLKG